MTPTKRSDLDYLPRLPREKSVGIGCIGAGFIMADCHLVAYRQAGFNPIAIAARRREQAQSVATRHQIPNVFSDYRELLDCQQVEVVDIAVPPDDQFEVVREVVKHADHVRAVLAQKPLGVNYAQACEIVRLCRDAGIVLAVNQNMRYDQSVRACRSLLSRGDLGTPVLATIDMRAIPHWMPWQARQGWVTLRIMSIHHLDTFRFWFGDPVRVFASVRPDPRTAFPHEDGICLYILEYANGLRAMSCDDVWSGPAKEGAASDIGIKWRIEGTSGMARGTIGWPRYPERSPSTLDFTTTASSEWHQPRWNEVWFPDAFVGPMAQLLCALEDNTTPEISGEDNLKTMALVEACYVSAREHRAIDLSEITDSNPVAAISPKSSGAASAGSNHARRSDVVGIVLAGGLGTRLQDVRPDCPKPLIECKGRPFIEWVLQHFQRSGVDRFVISLGHLADVAQRYFERRNPAGLTISTVVEPRPLGTAGAARFAWDGHHDRSALVLNGDSLLLADFEPLWKMWDETSADALVVGIPQADASRYGTLTFTNDFRLVSFEEKRPGSGVVNAGIYLFHPNLFSTIPPGFPLSLEKDVFPNWLKVGHDIRVCVIPGPFLDIGLPESLASADEFLSQHWPQERPR